MHQSIFVSPPTLTVTIATMATATFVWEILPINRQISVFMFFFILRVILKQLVEIMPLNNSSVRFRPVRSSLVCCMIVA